MTGPVERLASNNTTTTSTTSTTTTTTDNTTTTPAETGYVGNLTPAQEKKLQHLWRLLLTAFDFQEQRQQQQYEDGLLQDEQDGQGSVTAAGSLQGQGVGGQGGSAGATAEISANQKDLAHKLRETWLSMVKQENPDALLLRFLRARKWDVSAALGMLRNALVWRCDEMRVDEEVLAKGEEWCAEREKFTSEREGVVSSEKESVVKEEGKEKGRERGKEVKEKEKERKDAHDFLQQLRMGKVYIRGTDRRGRPVGYVKVSLHKPSEQSEETLEKLVVHTIETARCLFATCSVPAESFCVVFDLTDFSLGNMEWQPVKFIIRAFEANYPECLGTLLIHNAPWIFSGIWKIIRALLDPVVAAKVDFTRNTAGLEKYIARENIVSAYGGDDDWEYVYVEPSLDEDERVVVPSSPPSPPIPGSGNFPAQKEKEKENERESILIERHEIAERFLEATYAWIRHAEVPGESEEAAIQAQLRSNAVEALWANYWKLDPYVRSRTVLDRTGVIGTEGVVEMYPDRRIDAEEEDGKGKGKGKGDSATTTVATPIDEHLQDLTIQDLLPVPIKKKSWSRLTLGSK